ncbi:PepSY-like domain-containing protein [Christiangramia sp.]|uniref:PepSY-like domain-containing protein n=1 Tax=Christiangramia sp. TaxID=1931228 RepID=UPI002620190E|nr:PepSY-like domain-containing protein [Christiangramia sp.]
MKTYKIFLSTFLLLVLQSCTDNEESLEADLNAVAFSADASISTSTLPQNILDYITDNYPGLTIIEAEIEDNQNYEITLSDDTELVFDSEGNFLGEDTDEEDDFGDEEVEVSELPQNILDFIAQNYPGVAIEEAELENNGNYEVELENDVELIFDGDGNFLGQAQDENDDDQGEDEDINPANLPQMILDYIGENYPDNTIIEAEVESDGSYEVTLNNGVELEFDADGNFLNAEDNNGEDDDEDEND